MTQFIAIHDDALSQEVCQQIIDKFDANPNQQPGQTGGGVDPEKKLSLDLTITDLDDWRALNDQIISTTLEYIVDYWQRFHFGLIGPFGLEVTDPHTQQPVQLNNDNYSTLGKPIADQLVRSLYRPGAINVQRYAQGTGGYPHWHSEIFPKDQSCEQLHRVLLWMYYLNDVDEGGETDFFYQDQSITPKAGRMVIAPAGFTHTHRGLVPVSSDKYILTSWILFNRAQTIYG